MFSFPKTARAKYNKLRGLKKKVILSQFWKQEALNQSAGTAIFPLKALREDVFSLLSRRWRLSSVLDIPWFIATPLHLYMAFFPWSVCISVCSLIKIPVNGFWAHPNAVWPCLTLSMSVKVLFLNKFTYIHRCWDLGIEHIFLDTELGHNSTHYNKYIIFD